MSRIVVRTAVVFTLLALAPFHAAVSAPYAVEVIAFYNPGTGPNTDPTAALGAPDSTNSQIGLYSMGAYGFLDLRLGQPVLDIAGTDLVVWEESTYFQFGDDPLAAFPDEDADVYLSLDSVNWTLVGEARRGVAGSLAYDIAGQGVEGATYLRIVDISGARSTNAEGFDLDAVTIMEAAVVPVPAAIWLFASGLGLLGWIRRRGALRAEKG